MTDMRSLCRSTVWPTFIQLMIVLALWCAPALADQDELVVMLESAPKTLDPVFATDAYGVRISQQLIFQPLVQLGQNLEIVPALAERWEHPSPTLYRFYLTQNARFHDGSAVEGADVVYTLQSLMDVATGSPYGPALREKIAEIRQPEPFVIEIELKKPFAAFLSELTLPIRSRNVGSDNPLLGSGPYRFVAQHPGEIILERHEEFHGAKAGVARIVFKVVKDENTRILKLRKGSIDLAINAIPLDKIVMFQRPPLRNKYNVVEAPGLSYQYLGFNMDDPVLSNPTVREAIARAINVDALIAHRQKGHSKRATSLLQPGNQFELKSAAPIAYDPDLANAMLDEAGFPIKGEARFSLNYKTSTDRSAVIQARAIQSDLRKVGIDLAVRSFEWGTFYEDIQKGNFQLFSLRWVGVSDPDFYYELFHSSRMPPNGRNRVHYRNPEMDRLLEAGRIAQKEADRLAIYQEVQSLLIRDLPYVSLWHNNNIAIISNSIQGFLLHPTGGFHSLPSVQKTAP